MESARSRWRRLAADGHSVWTRYQSSVFCCRFGQRLGRDDPRALETESSRGQPVGWGRGSWPRDQGWQRTPLCLCWPITKHVSGQKAPSRARTASAFMLTLPSRLALLYT